MTVDARKIRLLMHLRRLGLGDTAVLSAIERVARELFLPDAFLDQAYEDTALPIGLGQTISQPLVVARMTQALEVGKRMKVLEIGTGSGYQTAILALLSRRVYTVERHRSLTSLALERLQRLRIHNVTSRVGDGTLGWPEQAPFDRIIVTAAATGDPPPVLTGQLATGGIMILPVSLAGGGQIMVRLRRNGDQIEREDLWPVRFVPLVPGSAPGGGTE